MLHDNVPVPRGGPGGDGTVATWRSGKCVPSRVVVRIPFAIPGDFVYHCHILGHEDSGMMGEATNDNPAGFWQADLDEAADRLAAILTEVGADVLTTYDDHGGYGHPDHIQVHRVGARAAERAGVTQVFESTMNREYILRLMAESLAQQKIRLLGAARSARLQLAHSRQLLLEELKIRIHKRLRQHFGCRIQ